MKSHPVWRWLARLLVCGLFIAAAAFVYTHVRELRSSGTAPAAAASPTPHARPSTTRKPSAKPTAASPRPSPVTTFTGTVAPIDLTLRATMTASGSWRPECPVTLDQLRLLTLSYWGFDGRSHVGRLVINQDVADNVVSVFRAVYEARYPIQKMRLIDDYGASEEKAMRDNDTVGYNGRWVYAQPGVWSQHAVGHAIDVNPVQNPYLYGKGKVAPPAGRDYLKRSAATLGIIHADDALVRAFAAVGWVWGGTWTDGKDYMHFSPAGN